MNSSGELCILSFQINVCHTTIQLTMSRVFAISDIHVDYAYNLQWIKNLSDADYQHDALLLAGDVSDRLPLLASTLKILKAKFKHVFFAPGKRLCT